MDRAELLQAEDAGAAGGQMVGGGAAHAAETDDDDIVGGGHCVPPRLLRATSGGIRGRDAGPDLTASQRRIRVIFGSNSGSSATVAGTFSPKYSMCTAAPAGSTGSQAYAMQRPSV